MPRTIDRNEVQRLLGQGAQLVDVLPQKEFGDSHLRGAINIPLQSLNAAATDQLSKDRPLIVYCFDYQ
jgi:rhodanese-related sulfurtransferase